MLIENKGIKTDTFYLPPFVLNEGEIIVVYLSNVPDCYDNGMFLKDIFTGKNKHENVIIFKNLTFIEHFKESKFRRFFYPITVGEYLRKNADLNSPFSNKIYENNWIKKNTHVNTLAGTSRKLLSLYSTLSRTKDIVSDLAALDPLGVENTYEIVREITMNGGSAILLDCFKDMKNNCSKYIELQLIK